MPFKIEIKEEARDDIADAMQWYATKAENLDTRFVTAVEAALLKIQRNPFAFKKVYKKFRQTTIKSFPYIILYEPEQNKVVIYSVFNTWQHPKKKLLRVKK
jgi:plasmid stabilization system protein ParE